MPAAPRARVLATALLFFDFAASDLPRYQLMNQRTLPEFTPTPDSYAPAVEVLARLEATLHRLGIDEPEARDMFTAVLGGFIDQQLANDPGGDRWRRLLGRAIDMYADHLGLPGPPLQEHR